MSSPESLKEAAKKAYESASSHIDGATLHHNGGAINTESFVRPRAKNHSLKHLVHTPAQMSRSADALEAVQKAHTQTLRAIIGLKVLAERELKSDGITTGELSCIKALLDCEPLPVAAATADMNAARQVAMAFLATKTHDGSDTTFRDSITRSFPKVLQVHHGNGEHSTKDRPAKTAR